jgi:hypothetical protein
MNTNINIQDKYYNKYIKYKTKYLELKQRGGSNSQEEGTSIVSTGTSVDTDTKSCICIGDIKEICNGYIKNMELELKPHNIYETHMKYFGNSKSNIKKIYIIIKDILNLLIKKNTYFIFGKKKISNIFKFIKKIINHLLYLYNEFGEYIYKQKIYSDKKILDYYDSTKQVIIDTITFYDTEINNKIQEINNKKNVNKDINNYIKEYKNYLKTLFPNHDFNINGLDNLQFIIISYFEEIKKGLICSIPNIKKYSSYKKIK